MAEDKQSRISFQVPAALFIVAALLLIPTWIGYSNVHKTERDLAAVHKSSQNLSECLGPDLSNLADCLRNADTEQFDKTLDYYNLKAQQDMAKWALLMLVVTTIGVGYIALTLSATRETLLQAQLTTEAAKESVAETRRVGQAQVRSYLSCTGGAFESDGSTLEIVLDFKNLGQSPGYNITFDCELVQDSENPDPETEANLKAWFSELKQGLRDVNDIAPGETERRAVRFELSDTFKDKTDFVWGALSHETPTVAITGVVRWRDVFDSEHSHPFWLSLVPLRPSSTSFIGHLVRAK